MLTTTSKYALRVLVRLDAHPSDEYVLGRTLAEATSVPPDYLSKILRALGRAEIVEAMRGRKGGYRLARDAREIRVIDVVEIFEGIRTEPSCLLGIRDRCSDEHPCSAHASFRGVREAYITFLEETSIAEAAGAEVPA